MEIVKNHEGGKLTVSLCGRLDGKTTPAAGEELLGSLDGVDSLVLDLADLVYISSVGLRLLVQVIKVMDERDGMTVRHVRPEVMEVFKTVMFDKILNIE